MIKAVNNYAILTFSYSFGIIKSNENDLSELNIKLRTMLNNYKLQYSNLYIKTLTLRCKL